MVKKTLFLKLCLEFSKHFYDHQKCSNYSKNSFWKSKLETTLSQNSHLNPSTCAINCWLFVEVADGKQQQKNKRWKWVNGICFIEDGWYNMIMMMAKKDNFSLSKFNMMSSLHNDCPVAKIKIEYNKNKWVNIPSDTCTKRRFRPACAFA